MFSPDPGKTLLLFGAVAVTVLAGGLRLARHEQTVRQDRDRAALRQFSNEAQDQLQRLERLYEEHLARLATDTPADEFNMRVAAERLVGIREFSLLRPAASKAGDRHVTVSPVYGQSTPAPVFAADSKSAGPVFLLDEAKYLRGPEASGWIDEPGKPLMFFQRRSPTELAVLTVDVPAVQTAASQWLRDWAAGPFAPVRAGGGPDALRVTGGPTLAAAGAKLAGGQPDLLLLLRNRLGAWELASWDKRATLVSHDPATLAVTATVTILITLLGAAIFVQQRRALALTARRVSFVNRVSHELRTPLTNILLNVDLAADAIEEAPRDAVRRLTLVREEAARLGRLIDNVLTFSQAGRPPAPRPAQVCVPDLVIAGVVEQFAPSFERRALGVQRTAGAGAACLLEADALAQILANLLSNVEKYVPEGSVEIRSALRDDTLVIQVNDTGPGIPPEAQERVFQPFERLYNKVSEGAVGAGLGLTIARDLAMRMGGSLRLAPSLGGASFELRVAALSAPTS